MAQPLDPSSVLDWLVPVTLAAIAWFLNRLDGSVIKLTEALGQISTAVAVLNVRVDKLEEDAKEHDCN